MNGHYLNAHFRKTLDNISSITDKIDEEIDLDENQYETEFEHSNQIDSEQFNQKTSANINTGVLNGQIVSQESTNGLIGSTFNTLRRSFTNFVNNQSTFSKFENI